jgi:hypothetical protein
MSKGAEGQITSALFEKKKFPGGLECKNLIKGIKRLQD